MLSVSRCIASMPERLKGNEVIVKTMPEGTLFVTLDEVERKLSDRDLMICNKEEAMCIAGVFGGLDSGSTEATTDVFIEEQEFAESKSNQENNSSSAASIAKPTPNPNPSAPDDNGFMNIPDGLDEELPFNFMDELMRIAKEHHFTADQLIQEAECVEEYGEWQHILLLGYSADMLRNAAEKIQ